MASWKRTPNFLANLCITSAFDEKSLLTQQEEGRQKIDAEKWRLKRS